MNNLFKSLAAFQQEVPTIHKGREGYGYSYAELHTILEVVNPLMAKHGLGFTQLLSGDNIKTIVFHAESGEKIESETTIPKVVLKGMNDYQSFGSGITYYRRYCLSAILGLVTDKDADAHGEQVKKIEQKPAPKTLKPVETEEQLKAIAEWIQSGKGNIEKAKAIYALTAIQLDDLEQIINQIK